MAQTQFRSDDTTPWWMKFGNGSDGAYSSAGNATDAPVDSSCSGTSGATSLSATNVSFAAGKPILIHQSRGTGAGNWELNQIASYVAGTITTVSPLKNTYTDLGASQAQVIQLKQYSSFTQGSGHTLTVKAWNDDVGGIIAFLCNGTTTITGTISAAGANAIDNSSGAGGEGIGFDGGRRVFAWSAAYQGHGTSGAGTTSTSANGNGGGGSFATSNPSGGGSGGGGGNGTAGANGVNIPGVTGTPGTGGSTAGSASLVTAVFGGGGGGSNRADYDPPAGGAGGAIVFIFTKDITVTGSVNLDGGNGGTQHGYSGGGAGGSCLIKAQTATLGTNKVTAAAGSAGSSYGGAGGVGRIHLDYLALYTGTTSPTIDVTQDKTLRSGSGMFAVL